MRSSRAQIAQRKATGADDSGDIVIPLQERQR